MTAVDLDQDVAAILAERLVAGGPAAHEMPVADARALHEGETIELGGPRQAVSGVHELRVPSAGGGVPVRAYVPRVTEAEGAPPIVVWFHGGGWVVGSLESYEPLCRALANASGAVVASVGYRLAPEHPFPAALEDSLAVTRWLAEHPEEAGGDGARLALAGDSAGGNLAAVVARRLRDEDGPRLRLQALVYPVIDGASEDRPSFRDFAEGFGLTALGMRRYWELYLDGADAADPDASPLRAADLAGLPPAFILTAEADVLRDEGEAYANALHDAGVPVTLARYDGVTHGFVRWLARVPTARTAVQEVGDALRAALR